MRVFVAWAAGGALVGAACLARSPVVGSPIALSPDGELLVVVNPDSGSLSVVSTGTLEKLVEIPVGGHPQTVAVDPDGRLAYVVDRAGDSVVALDLVAGQVAGRAPVGDEPFGVVVGEERLYVTAQGASTVEVLRRHDLSHVARVPTEADPRGLALSSDGAELYVTHFTSGRLSVVDTAGLDVVAVVATGADANLAQGIAIAPGGRLAYLPHTRSNATNPALLFDTTLFPVVSVVDLGARAHLASQRIALDIADRPVSLPLAAASTATGKLYVLNAGSNDLSVVDLATGTATAHVEVEDNPRGLALSPDERTLYVSNSLAGTVSVIDTAVDQVVEVVRVTEIPLPPAVLRGKILFNSSDLPELARDQWVSCAGCHFDAEMDRRTWLFADGPRNTPSLLGVRETLPIHWSGDLDELQDVERTIRTLQAGSGLAEGPDNCEPSCDQGPPNSGRSRELDDLAAYLRFLSFPPNPNLVGGELGAAAVRGKSLFLSETTGCADCHPPPLYTDRTAHDVGTATSTLESKGPAFDTPSLRGIYGTAPYLHDGSAATLEEVLTVADPGGRHGRISQLTAGELTDLVGFLRSLPLSSEVCEPGPATACLLGRRFEVRGEMYDFASPPRRFETKVMSFPTGRAESDQAAFFESFEKGNFEVGVKMVDACGLPPGDPLRAFWLFVGGLTNAETEVLVEDTVSGELHRWRNPAATFPVTLGHTRAFPCTEGSPASPCVRDEETACLLAGRFRVGGSMKSFATPPETFPLRVMSFPSGRAESDQAAFFESFAEGNFEVGVKMVDACGLPAGDPLRAFWAFYGGLTNAETRITVTQIVTGLVDEWVNPAGAFPRSEGRTSAFPCE